MTKLGSEIICDALEQLGATTVFGMPGTQNVPLYEALSKSKLRTITTTNELAATMAAVGYYRASGKTGVVTTIPGPGFTFALTGLAEASLDSCAVLHIVSSSGDGSDRLFQHQYLDLASIARPIVKDVLVVTEVGELAETVATGYRLASSGEPGPVLIIFDKKLYSESGEVKPLIPSPAAVACDPKAAEEVSQALSASRKIAFLVGQGGQGERESIAKLALLLNAAVLTTNSGRGAISEDDPHSLYYDYSCGGGDTVNEFIEQCDLVLALGCKLSHNGSGGFRLRIPREKLIHVDTSERVLNANYPARLAIQTELNSFFKALVPKVSPAVGRGWSPDEIRQWRTRCSSEQVGRMKSEPMVLAGSTLPVSRFIESLQNCLAENSCIVTDSGLHQVLIRRHACVRTERGLITPADFQSMGFGLPAALGAKVAAPDRAVVAVIGDGGMGISGMELLTAVREKIHLTVVVFNDGYLNLIRMQQLEGGNREHATKLVNPDFAVLAESIGANYFALGENLGESIRTAVTSPGVNLLEVILTDSAGLAGLRVKGVVRREVRKLVKPTVLKKLKKYLGR
jgi:acetolactate synthase I/II/III large subunit